MHKTRRETALMIIMWLAIRHTLLRRDAKLCVCDWLKCCRLAVRSGPSPVRDAQQLMPQNSTAG